MRTAIVVATAFVASLAISVGFAALLPKIPGVVEDARLTQESEDKHATVAVKNSTVSRDDLLKQYAIESDKAAADQAWAEKLFPDGITKDFGTVPMGTQLSHRFKLTNIYAMPVQITGFRINCGCSKARAEKRTVQPGESTTVEVNLDTRGFTGLKTQSVFVGIGPSPNTTCKLLMTVVSQTDVVFHPERVAFGTAIPGRASVHRIEVEYTGSHPWAIDDVIIAKELPFKAVLSKLDRIGGKIRYRLEVSLNDNAHFGAIRDYIYLKTNQPDIPPVAVLVTADVRESLDADKP